MKKQRTSAFTLIEIVVVISVIGVIATLVYSLVLPRWKERGYYTRSISELNTMANALNLYVAKYNDYPADADRDVPAGIKEFTQGQEGSNTWPDAPYPDSVYDYEAWPAGGPYDPEPTYQISIRFCNGGQHAICKAKAQKYLKDYVDANTLNNWDSESSMYFCIKGSCRAHKTKPTTHPGYCINCGQKSKAF